MNLAVEIMTEPQSTDRSALGGRSQNSPPQPPTVVIIGPPWPRSGAARVMKNQIDYYHFRGYHTVFVVVPFHRYFMRDCPVWQELRDGIQELGADQFFIAPLDKASYKSAKLRTSLRHAFRGTALDWEAAIGNSAKLPDDLMDFLHSHSVALIQANYLQTLGFAARLQKKLSRHVPIILETHDVQSHLHQERRERNPWSRKPESFERSFRSEISLLQKADVLIHLSFDDFRLFQKELPGKPHILAMPVVDPSYVDTVNASAPLKEPIDLLFVGQKHAPNLKAVQWFLEQVWPLLAQKNYHLKIVGPVDTLVRENLPELLKSFPSAFVGPVADLSPYYSSARCLIAPMVSGSGTSIKTIEALALGKPFVGTSKAFRGMPFDQIQAAGIQAYDSPRAFAGAVVAALANFQQASAQSRAAYDRVFSLQANCASRDEAVRVAKAAKK